MTVANYSLASIWRLLAGLIFCSIFLSACDKGPFSPEARGQAAARDQYLKALQTNLVTDGTFNFGTLSADIIVRVLPLNQMVRQAADHRFLTDQNFTREVDQWLKPPRGLAGNSTVILMGLFTQDLAEGDLTELQRFRPRLLTSAGHLLEPVSIEDYGRDQSFIQDHFPVFNPWEAVFIVKFPPTKTTETLIYQLQWPGGIQNLVLNPPGSPGAAS